MIPAENLLRFIEEDAPSGDATSEAVVPDISCRARIIAEDDGTVAGLAEARALFSHFGVDAVMHVQDGDKVQKSAILIELNGEARKILLVERTALNIIGRMSGIATKTRKLADLVATVNPHCRVAATRKTCPGCRRLDKKAVLIGGGDPHREGLSDGILIKDNHLALVPLPEAIRRAKRNTAYRKVEVEVETPDDAILAVREGADIIMLDNMPPDAVRRTCKLIRTEGLRGRVVIEISGGITDYSIAEYAALDVDRISMGSLTHSVNNFPVTLEIEP
jgi:nicotinate-nucleotide pyrophosphorylase (carboxylating)